jgi:hypothetical protein
MRRKQVVACCFALTALCCSKEEPPPFGDGLMTATVNGKPWKGTGYAISSQRSGGQTCPINTVNFSIGSSEAYPNARLNTTQTSLDCIRCDQTQSLFFTKMPLAVQSGKINQVRSCQIDSIPGASYSTIVGGDATGAVYNVLETKSDNQFRITSYNPATGELRGTFQLTFLRDKLFGSQAGKDTLRFQNGEFALKIKQ